jgi:hypothetical protein
MRLEPHLDLDDALSQVDELDDASFRVDSLSHSGHRTWLVSWSVAADGRSGCRHQQAAACALAVTGRAKQDRSGRWVAS